MAALSDPYEYTTTVLPIMPSAIVANNEYMLVYHDAV